MGPLDGRIVRRLIVAAVLAAPVFAATGTCEQAGSGSSSDQQSGLAVPATPPAAAGMRIHRHPVTGELLPEPPAGAAAAPLPRQAGAFRESRGVSPAGGVKLEGDFRMGVRATADGAGQAVTDCVPARALEGK